MKKVKRNLRLFQTVIAIMIILHNFNAWSQMDTSMLYKVAPCWADVDYFKRGGVDCSPGSTYAPSSPATTFPDSIIMHCGKIAVYFEDVHQHFHRGFDDTTHYSGTTVGVLRRNTFCAVLTYIQSVFDFSNVDSSHPIRIYMDTSYDPIVHPSYGVPGLARAFPQYDSSTDGITNGWMNAYVICTNPLSAWYHHDSIPPDKYHGFIQVNFDRVFTPGIMPYKVLWDNDYTSDTCSNYDLFSTLLHETAHCMGWYSLVYFTGGYLGLAPQPSIFTHNVFTGLDWSMYTGTVYPGTTLTKLIAGTPSLPYIPFSGGLLNNNNYWLNNKAAPENHPVYSGYNTGPMGAAVNSYLSHMDDQTLCYTLRQRISPGDQQEYLMAPFGETGNKRRKYAKGELQTLVDVLGYELTPGFTAANPYIYSNHVDKNNPIEWERKTCYSNFYLQRYYKHYLTL